jgi:hypothetical protein
LQPLVYGNTDEGFSNRIDLFQYHIHNALTLKRWFMGHFVTKAEKGGFCRVNPEKRLR